MINVLNPEANLSCTSQKKQREMRKFEGSKKKKKNGRKKFDLKQNLHKNEANGIWALEFKGSLIYKYNISELRPSYFCFTSIY